MSRNLVHVLDVGIDAIDWEQSLSLISSWAVPKSSRYICICNVHSVFTCHVDDRFSKVIMESDLATPDGAPIAWMIRRMGVVTQQRINGPDLMWKYCAVASERGESIFLYGSTVETLELLKLKLILSFPRLIIAGSYSPPFRAITVDEDSAVVDLINSSGASTVWVGLGCPKQEFWMSEHRGRINAVMVGVGAAFDYHAGVIRRAPSWVQGVGFEWLFRLLCEPRRLWRRYLSSNIFFVLGACRQLFFRIFTSQ
jgi:N-acetylglucosaminyldiphosphoundecaprenol N-acetyl-beta-D-mannosaminyltransferase